MEKIKMNRRGDVSTTILVVGVFAICVLAIMSFIISGNGFNNSFAKPVAFQQIDANVQSYYFYLDTGMSVAQSAKKAGATIDGNFVVFNASEYTSDYPVRNSPAVFVQYKLKINENK